MPLTVMSLSAIAASISAQFFNSWQSNKKSKELIARQREFQRAAQEKDFVRMRRIQQEAEQLALELEYEVHQQRLKDIESNYDEIIEDFAKQFTIKLWPLKVLPFVMRGESFGTIINGTKSVALHCILTPSNCNQFNRAVYQDIDLRLESLCNEYWNAQSTHPIVYYGDSWRKSELDLDDIELLHTQLKSIPTIVITPYFSPNLYFKVKLWGMGRDSEFEIIIPEELFSYEYIKDMEYFPEDEIPADDIYNHTIEELVPYILYLIGYITDQYYWNFYKIAPQFLSIINKRKLSSTQLLKNISTKNYINYLDEYLSRLDVDFLKAIDLSNQLLVDTNENKIEIVIKSYFEYRHLSYNTNETVEYNILNSTLTLDDIPIIQKLYSYGYIGENTFNGIQKSVYADNYIYVYNISELFDILINEYHCYDKYIFQVRKDKICIGYFEKNGTIKKFLVSIIYSNLSVKKNAIYKFDIKNGKCSYYEKQSDIILRIPNSIFNENSKSTILTDKKQIDSLISLGHEFCKTNTIEILSSKLHRINKVEIVQWIKQSHIATTNIYITRTIINDMYYLILQEVNNNNEVARFASYKMYSLDWSLREKFKHSLILTIKK